MKKPASIEDAREWLQGVADFLDRVPYASSRLAFAANAIRNFLNGTQPSLDHAFGLVRSRGAQKRDSMHRAAVTRAIEMRLEGKTWKRICNELPFDDERELRRMCVKSFAEVMGNMLAAELKADGLGV